MMCKRKKLVKKGYRILFIVTIVLMLFGGASLQAGNMRSRRADLPKQANQNNNLEPKEKLTVWSIIKMTDWLFWPFVLITASGILIITYRTLYEHREKSRSQALLQERIRANGIRGLVGVIKSNGDTRASRLMFQMITTFDKTNRAEPIGDDVNQFLGAERESFETFNRINSFLSETAGALGLLGTVWGIFQTFHAGKLDGPTILQGMSISLVTTLVGLIISLVLNMGGTYVFTLFNGQLNLLANRAEELRQALLYLEKRSNGNGNGNGHSQNLSHIRVADADFRSRKHGRVKQPADFAY